MDTLTATSDLSSREIQVGHYSVLVSTVGLLLLEKNVKVDTWSLYAAHWKIYWWDKKTISSDRDPWSSQEHFNKYCAVELGAPPLCTPSSCTALLTLTQLYKQFKISTFVQVTPLLIFSRKLPLRKHNLYWISLYFLLGWKNIYCTWDKATFFNVYVIQKFDFRLIVNEMFAEWEKVEQKLKMFKCLSVMLLNPKYFILPLLNIYLSKLNFKEWKY